ncbi:MAG: HWE histidine kinase domain-containing protein [Myxococcota bacterium]
MKSLNPEEVALDNCSQEPIHIPGHIQDVGALLACTMDFSQITAVSENIEGWVGMPIDAVMGSSLRQVLPRSLAHDVRNAAGRRSISTQREVIADVVLGDRTVTPSVHRSGESFILEFEETDDRLGQPVDLLKAALGRLLQANTLNKLLRAAARTIRSMSRHARVSVLRFFPNGDGEVIVEDRLSTMSPLMGLRFPRWDVPDQARALSMEYPLRYLPDVQGERIWIRHLHADAPPLDLRLARIRGLSPIHCEYLTNMGVGGSMTLPIIVSGQLWGYFTCHHPTAHRVSPQVLNLLEIFSSVTSMKIQQQQEEHRLQKRQRAAQANQLLLEITRDETHLIDAFSKIHPLLQEMIPADGLMVQVGRRRVSIGSVPGDDFFSVVDLTDDLMVAVDNLREWLADRPASLRDSAGMLMLGLTPEFSIRLMFFRDEIPKQVRWAGPLVKDIKHGPRGPRLHPRKSFDAYVEGARDQAKPWEPDELEMAREIRTSLLELFFKEKKLEHINQQEILIAELNHRVRNLLALIRALARQTQHSSRSIESYVLALEARISALASAHDLAVRQPAHGINIRQLLRIEMEPHNQDDRTIQFEGPALGVLPEYVTIFALLIHELASNAARHGALSASSGQVTITWGLDDAFRLQWIEANGPTVTPPTRQGFGMSLIKRAVEQELHGKLDLQFHPEGLFMEMQLPPSVVTLGIKEIVPLQPHAMASLSVRGRVLMVEDNAVLAMDMEDLLMRIGFDEVDSVATSNEAQALLTEHDYAIALLDINLGHERSFRLASQLLQQQIPCLFVTGYGSDASIPDSLQQIPIIMKPVNDVVLKTLISSILGS